MIICNECNKSFESFDGMPFQGDGISSFANKEGVQCFYGSIYDGNYYTFDTYVLNGESKSETICDNCIETLIKQGKIELVSEDNLLEVLV